MEDRIDIAAAEAGRAHQGLVRDAVADRLRAKRQVRQRAAPVPDGIRPQVPGRADIAPEHGQLDDEGLGAVAVQAAGEDEGAVAGRRHSPRRRDRGPGAQGARARSRAQVAHVAVRGARVRKADLHLRIQPDPERQGGRGLPARLVGLAVHLDSLMPWSDSVPEGIRLTPPAAAAEAAKMADDPIIDIDPSAFSEDGE